MCQNFSLIAYSRLGAQEEGSTAAVYIENETVVVFIDYCMFTI